MSSHRAIITLCGSTRFWRTFQQASLLETLSGNIVLSIGSASGTDDDHFGGYLPRDEYDQVKADLDRLHLDKIAMSHGVLILNVGDYIGQSTTAEVRHARELGKAVTWWEWPSAHAVDGEPLRVYPDRVTRLAGKETRHAT